MDNIVSAVNPLSFVEDSNVDVLIGVIAVVNTDIAAVLGSDSVVEVNRVASDCWTVVSSIADENISVVVEGSSDVLSPSVIIDIENGDVPIEDDVVSTVELLSLVDESNVVVVIADIGVGNVD